MSWNLLHGVVGSAVEDGPEKTMLLLAHAGRPDHSPWNWHAHPDVIVVAVVLALGYWWAIRRLGPRLVTASEPITTPRQVSWLVSAIALFWLMSDWPIHDLSEGYLYSVHMVQHLVYTLVLPPMFIWGTPPWLWRWLLRPLLPVVRLITRPLIALIVFNTIVAATHSSALVTAAVKSGPIHLAQHIVIVATALIMWWPVLNPLPELRRLPPPLQMGYLFLQSLVPTVPASFLTFAEVPIYKIYAEFPRVSSLSAVADQQLAGGIMKLGGGIILWGAIAVIFFRWFGEDDRSRRSGSAVRATTAAPVESHVGGAS